MDLKLHSQFVTGGTRQRILRAWDVRTEGRAVALYRNVNTAFAKFLTMSASRAQTESSLAPFQVRDTHAGKQNSREFLRRESHRHTNHRTKNTRFAEPMPERCSAAHAFDSGTAERDRVFANPPTPLRSLNLRRGQVGKVVAKIPRQEIVDVV